MNDFVPLLKHNPSAQDPAVLEAITVQREPLIASLVEAVLDSDGGLRHQLLVGPRGMGKTHILSLVVSRVRAERDAGDVVIAWLDEDPWSIRSYAKFLAAIIARVAEEIGDSDLARRAAELRSGEGAGSLEGEEILRGALAGRRLVLLVENLDEVFRRIGQDGQAKFRAFAEDWRQMLIFATSPQLFEGVRDHASPFYGFFAITHLDELSFESAVELMKRIAELHDDAALRAYLDSEVAMQRLAAVEALAGGHPRIWMLFAGCISIEAIDELVPLFLEALDDLTPYYQDRLRELSDQQQELVVLLGEAGGALSNRALAERSGISQNQIATMLRHLTDRGYIRRAEVPEDLAVGDARMSYWELREPLMRLCLDVKQARGAPLRMIVEFLRTWYGPRLLDEIVRLPPEAKLATVYASEAFRALKGEISADDLFRGSPREVLARAEAGLSLQPDRYELQIARMLALVENQQFEEAAVAIEELLEASEAGRTVFLELRLIEVRRALGEVSEQGYVAGLESLLDDPDVDATIVLSIAEALADAQRWPEALASADRALELDPAVAQTHGLRGMALSELGRSEEALAAFGRATELDPEGDEFWANLGVQLNRLSRYKDALAAFTKVVELNPDSAWGHERRGHALIQMRRNKEALAAYDAALSLEPDNGIVHGMRALPLFESGRYEAGIKALTKAVAVAPPDPDFRNSIGLLLAGLGHREEALEAFARAAELDPGEAAFEGNRGAALGRLGHPDVALSAYDKAIELDPGESRWYSGRGDALADLGLLSDALEAYERALEIDPENPDRHANRADLLRRIGRVEEAEQAVRNAIEFDREEPSYRFTLAAVLFAAGDGSRGASALREAFELAAAGPEQRQPGDARLLCQILWEAFESDPKRRDVFAAVAAAYADFGATEELGRGLVTSISTLAASHVSLERAEAWIEDWSSLSAGSELEIPLNLLRATLGWKRDRDRAHLLELPAEQREILIPLLRIED